ncbi:PAS domain-containing protein [Alteromonas gracilis]|uniref:PAS domain-containing protein n=1 Tax=Alteromonas gracilis TaxID=1479524 RepID=UPI0037367AB1
MAKEINFSPNEIIVSKTDLSGRITYANRLFMRVCNYPESELLGKPHRIIRHPDMPRGVFYGMWKTLKSHEEFFGFVKNSTYDGNYYWVFANVTPDFHNQKPVGYYSVRRVAPKGALTDIIDIYEKMREIERKCDKASAPETSWEWMVNYCAEQTSTNYDEFILNHYQQYR